MIFRTFSEIAQSVKTVKAESCTSYRFLVRQDSTGFSLHETRIHADTETPICYKHHLEAVCFLEEGQIDLVGTGEEYVVRPGEMYALNQHDVEGAYRLTENEEVTHVD